MMRGAYDSTQDKYCQFPFSVHEWPVFGSERPDLGSDSSPLGCERPDLGSKKPELGSERPNLGTDWPEMGSESPYLGSKGLHFEALTGEGGRMDRFRENRNQKNLSCVESLVISPSGANAQRESNVLFQKPEKIGFK